MAGRAKETFAQRYDMRRNAEAILRVFENPRESRAHADPIAEAR
jgi:hypothetical protein